MITQYVQKCEFCQRYNKENIKYGQISPKLVKHLTPWEEVHVDLVGSWKVTMNQFEYEFRALTCVDSVIGLHKVTPVDKATSVVVGSNFKNNWLSGYPAPFRCVHDNSNGFLGPVFSTMLRRNKIKSVPTAVKNFQSNAIVERMHQSISTMLAISLRKILSTKLKKFPP